MGWSQVSVQPERVREMFDRISPSYDRMNRVMSLGMDGRWREAAVRAARLEPGDAALDVCCGTGDLAIELRRVVGPGGRVVGLDFSEQMLDVARAKSAAVEWMQGDALELPFADGEFAAATVGWGVRNLADRELGFREMARVVRPGGRIVCLEMSQPPGWAAPFAHVVDRPGGARPGQGAGGRWRRLHLLAGVRPRVPGRPAAGRNHA